MPMDKPYIKKRIKANVAEIDPDAEVILFGSQARGDEGSESDWDVLILVNDPVTFQLEQRFIENMFELELELAIAISPFVYARSDWKGKHSITPLYQNISEEGVQL